MKMDQNDLKPGSIELLEGLILRTQIQGLAHDFELTPQEAIELGRTLMLAGETYRRMEVAQRTNAHKAH
jgi:hypothetical protein